MIGKIHPDSVETDDIFLASFIVYSGIEIMKAAVSQSTTNFTFVIKREDFVCIKEEMDNPEQSILIKPFVESMRKVFSVQ